MTSLIAIKLYNSFSSLSLTFLLLLYPFNISIHPERGSFRFIIPYEQVIARSLIVWENTESPKSIIDLTVGFKKSFVTIMLLSLISLWIIDFSSLLYRWRFSLKFFINFFKIFSFLVSNLSIWLSTHSDFATSHSISLWAYECLKPCRDFDNSEHEYPNSYRNDFVIGLTELHNLPSIQLINLTDLLNP